jgi:glutathione S-transferase
MREWYEAGLKETWRIARYEEEARAAGEVVADFRAAK